MALCGLYAGFSQSSSIDNFNQVHINQKLRLLNNAPAYFGTSSVWGLKYNSSSQRLEFFTSGGTGLWMNALSAGIRGGLSITATDAGYLKTVDEDAGYSKDLFIYTGAGPSGRGKMWLGSNSTGPNWINDVYAKTQLSTDSSNLLATTAFVKRISFTGGGGGGTPAGDAGEFQLNSAGAFGVLTGFGTESGGVRVKDNIPYYLGTGKDMELLHDGTSNFIKLHNGDLLIGSDYGTGDLARFYNTGRYVDLRFQGSSRIKTTTGGVDITGNITFQGGSRVIAPADVTTGAAGDALTVHGADLVSSPSGTGGTLLSRGGDNPTTGGYGGNHYVRGGLATHNGDVWLGYDDAGYTAVGNVYAKTQTASDNSQKLATTAYVDRVSLPSATSQRGKFISSNNSSWVVCDTIAADWTFNAGKKVKFGSIASIYANGTYLDQVFSNGYRLLDPSGNISFSATANAGTFWYYAGNQVGGTANVGGSYALSANDGFAANGVLGYSYNNTTTVAVYDGGVNGNLESIQICGGLVVGLSTHSNATPSTPRPVPSGPSGYTADEQAPVPVSERVTEISEDGKHYRNKTLNFINGYLETVDYGDWKPLRRGMFR